MKDLPARTAERGSRHDFDRLESAVTQLVDQHARMRDEKADLEARLEARESRIRELEAELEESRMRRQRASQRLDALIAALDQLDGEALAAVGDGARTTAPSSRAGWVTEPAGRSKSRTRCGCGIRAT